jgi:hypothetical protein
MARRVHVAAIGLAHVAVVLMDMALTPNLLNKAATDAGV